MLPDPRMIEPHVVRDEIEHELETSLPQSFAQSAERGIAAEIPMHGVARNREAGSGDIARR